MGVNVYNQGDRISPKINFPWSEVNRISHKGDNFIVKLNDKKSPKFVGVCKNKQSKKIYIVASGNHEMYIRRRRPDTLEVQQMKSQKRDEEAARAKEKAAMEREMAARMKGREEELETAQSNIRKLEEQLQQLREAKEQL